MLPLPMTPKDCLSFVIDPALELLPKHLTSDKARCALLAISLQESDLAHRWQVLNGGGKGPARGLWEFEMGSKAARGGVWGVYLHHASHELLRQLCRDVDCNFEPHAIWSHLEHSDILAAGVARLLMWTDRFSLPEVADEAGCWEMYAERLWRPGRPHPLAWPANHRAAREALA